MTLLWVPIWHAVGDYIVYPAGWLLIDVAPTALEALAEIALSVAGIG